MSTVLKAWRSNPTLEDMEQALHFAEILDPTQLRLCLRLAEVTRPEKQSYFARISTLVENWGPESIQDWMLDEVVLMIGLLHLKSLNKRGGLMVTFQSIDQKLTLCLQFAESLFIYSLLERRIGHPRSLPPGYRT
jgi:hypothetical protein